MTSPLTFTYEGRSFVEGKTELLDGESALRFARMRYDDPEGDTGLKNVNVSLSKNSLRNWWHLILLQNFEQIIECGK